MQERFRCPRRRGRILVQSLEDREACMAEAISPEKTTVIVKADIPKVEGKEKLKASGYIVCDMDDF